MRELVLRRTCSANALSDAGTSHLLPLANMGQPAAPAWQQQWHADNAWQAAAWRHARMRVVQGCQPAASPFTLYGHAEQQRALHQQRRIQHATLPVLQHHLQLQRQREHAVRAEALLKVPAVCAAATCLRACALVVRSTRSGFQHSSEGGHACMRLLTCTLASSPPGSLPQRGPMLPASQKRCDPRRHLRQMHSSEGMRMHASSWQLLPARTHRCAMLLHTRAHSCWSCCCRRGCQRR